MSGEDMGVAASPPGHQPTASEPHGSSCKHGVPDADSFDPRSFYGANADKMTFANKMAFSATFIALCKDQMSADAASLVKWRDMLAHSLKSLEWLLSQVEAVADDPFAQVDERPQGQDPKGLGAKPASAVGEQREADAPKDPHHDH